MPRLTPPAFALIALLLAAGCAAPSGDAGRSGAASSSSAPSADHAATAANAAPAPPAPASAVPAAPASATVSVAPADSRLVTIEVGGMVCQACEVLVGKELRSVPGVTAATCDLPHQRFAVTCGPGVADSSLVEAVRRAGPHYLGMIAE